MKLEAELWKFFYIIFRGRHFERGSEGLKFSPIFIVQINISYKDPTKNYTIFCGYDDTKCFKIFDIICIWFIKTRHITNMH